MSKHNKRYAEGSWRRENFKRAFRNNIKSESQNASCCNITGALPFVPVCKAVLQIATFQFEKLANNTAKSKCKIRCLVPNVLIKSILGNIQIISALFKPI